MGVARARRLALTDPFPEPSKNVLGCPITSAARGGKENATAPLPHSNWQKRFYDFNVWTAKKEREKLVYMHHNPVKRGLVERPEDWRWSSYRYYAFGEKGPVTINV